MTHNAKPATPLPWRLSMASDMRVSGADGIGVASTAGVSPRREDQSECAANAAYIVTACNAYPQLVAALHDVLSMSAHGVPGAVSYHDRTGVIDKVRALLRSLGEAQ